LKKIGQILGTILLIASGILTFIFWLISLYSWLGILGIFLGILLTPGIVIFPIVFWIVEGVFPLLYFIIWVVGIFGNIIRTISSEK